MNKLTRTEAENVKSFDIKIRLHVITMLDVRIICIEITTNNIDCLLIYNEFHLNDLFYSISFINMIVDARKKKNRIFHEKKRELKHLYNIMILTAFKL